MSKRFMFPVLAMAKKQNRYAHEASKTRRPAASTVGKFMLAWGNP